MSKTTATTTMATCTTAPGDGPVESCFAAVSDDPLSETALDEAPAETAPDGSLAETALGAPLEEAASEEAESEASLAEAVSEVLPEAAPVPFSAPAPPSALADEADCSTGVSARAEEHGGKAMHAAKANARTSAIAKAKKRSRPTDHRFPLTPKSTISMSASPTMPPTCVTRMGEILNQPAMKPPHLAKLYDLSPHSGCCSLVPLNPVQLTASRARCSPGPCGCGRARRSSFR